MAAGNDDRVTDIRGDVRGEIREFLSTRRARISPAQAGLPTYGGDRRRVSGLRREWLSWPASPASTTPGWSAATPPASDSVIDAIAHALQLDEAERTHLLDLLRTAGTTRPLRRRAPARPAHRPARPGLDGRHTRVRAQRAPGYPGRQPARAGAVLAGLCRPGRPPNNAGFVFLDLQATEFFGEWDKVANDTVALLRAEAGRNRYDQQLSDLIEELSTRSEEFQSDGPPTTSGSTPPAPSASTTRSSETWSWRSSPSRWPPTPARASSPHRRTRIALPGRPPPAGQLGRDHPRHRTACGYRRP